MILITYLEFSNGNLDTDPTPQPSKLDYAEWLRDGIVEYSHADTGPADSIRTDQGEVEGIPADVRQAIAKLVLED
jgi:hypothetical protein